MQTIFPKKKGITTIILFGCILVALVALFGCSRQTPGPTPTPEPLYEEQKIAELQQTIGKLEKTIEELESLSVDTLRQRLDKLEASSLAKYHKSLAFLDRRTSPLDTNALTGCSRAVHVRALDKNGALLAETENLALIFGRYVITSSAVWPYFPDPDDIPLPPMPPGITQEEYEKAIENFKRTLLDPDALTYLIWLQWSITPLDPQNEDGAGSVDFDFIEKVKIEDEDIANELQQAGLMVFKRQIEAQRGDGTSIVRPSCIALLGTIKELTDNSEFSDSGANSDDNEKLGILVYPEHIESKIGLLEGHLVAVSDQKNGFYFQGSVIQSNLGAPVYMFSMNDQEPKIVGIVTGTAASYGVETRAFATDINYILNLLKSAGIDVFAQDNQENAEKNPKENSTNSHK